MSAVPFHYLDIRTFCYATEDELRVQEALRAVLPPDCTIERETSTGHHGDPIVVLSARVETADEMRYVMDRLSDILDFDRVIERIADRVDEDCSFFVRIDKQRAYRGEVRLGPGIQIRGKVETYPASREGAIETLETYFAEG